jgi:hypothetical protein
MRQSFVFRLRIASLSAVARHFHRTEAALRQSVKRHLNYP